MKTLACAILAVSASLATCAGSAQAPSVTWYQQTRLATTDPVAVSGNTLLVGAQVYVQSGGVWNKQATLKPGDSSADFEFGAAVAIDGDTAVVADPSQNVGSNSRQGAVYVFTRNGGTWTKQAEIKASDGTSLATFGYAVAISGNWMVVGAPYQGAGAAYFFEQSGSTWTQEAEFLSNSSPSGGLEYGTSVAIDGETAVVGAPLAFRGNTQNGLGEAEVFTQSDGAWSSAAILLGSDSATGSLFGESVAVSGDTVVVGDPYETISDYKTGAAYLYVLTGDSPQFETVELRASDEFTGYNAKHTFYAPPNFGMSVAIDGNYAMVGAPSRNFVSADTAGAVYMFANTGSTWTQQWETVGTGTFEALGTSVAVKGATAAAVGSEVT